MSTEKHIEILTKLGLSEIEVSVYLVMLQGQVQVKDIQAVTGIKRPSVYYALSSLEKRGLIGRLQVGEYNQWKVSSLVRLKTMVAERVQELEELSESVSAFAEGTPIVSPSEQTKVTYYHGRKAIESIVFNSLYCKGKFIRSIAPDNNFFIEVGLDFAERYITERKKRGIKTQNLWESILNMETVRKHYLGVSEMRMMPMEMKGKFKTTVFIYDDKVMYIAPLKSNYAVLFDSVDHAEFMKALYDAIWANAKFFKTSRE